MMRKRNCYELYYKTTLTILSVVGGINVLMMMAVFMTVAANGDNFVELIAACSVFVLIFAPFIAYYAVKYHYYKNVELTNMQEVVLQQVTSGYTKLLGFIVDVEIDGEHRTMETKRVFSTGMMSAVSVGRYSMQKVTVGYNEEKDEIVVFELPEEDNGFYDN